MRFTVEDFKQIQSWLQFNGVKDTHFDTATLPLRGDETIVLVQNGKNVQMPLMDFITEVSILSGNVDVNFIKQTMIDLLNNDPDLLINSLMKVMTENIEWQAVALAEDDPQGPTAEVEIEIEDI